MKQWYYSGKLKLIFQIIFIISTTLFLCGFACNPNVSQTIDTILAALEGLIPLIAGVGAILLPAEATAITAAQGIAVTAIQAVQKAYDEYAASPSDTLLEAFQNVLTTAHDNLSSLLQAAQVKDVNTMTKITAIVNSAIAALAVLEATILKNHAKMVTNAQQTA